MRDLLTLPELLCKTDDVIHVLKTMNTNRNIFACLHAFTLAINCATTPGNTFGAI